VIIARELSNKNGGNSNKNNSWKNVLFLGLNTYVKHIDKD
jgi:hypothetical protein